jgi:hypothetical protein
MAAGVGAQATRRRPDRGGDGMTSVQVVLVLPGVVLAGGLSGLGVNLRLLSRGRGVRALDEL